MNRIAANMLCAAALLPGGAGATETGHIGPLTQEAAMKPTLGPAWTPDDIAAENDAAEKWKTFASNTGDDTGGTPFGAGSGKVTEVLARHEADLMAYPNVVAVSDGICKVGDDAGKACINVYVSQKVASDALKADQRLPDQLDGVRVEVIEAGEIGTLPME